jgi:putative ABC transport system permease protein
MEIASLNRLLGEDDVISGAYLSVDSQERTALYRALKGMPAVAGVGLPEVSLKSFNETFGRTIGAFTFVLVFFAGTIVLGVSYNSARIALAERGREFASLRVLGFTKGEVARVLFGEQAVLTAIAIPFGWAIGMLLCYLVNHMVDRELMRMPVVFSVRTFLATALIVFAAMMLSSLLVSRRIARLDLIEVLKTRE